MSRIASSIVLLLVCAVPAAAAPPVISFAPRAINVDTTAGNSVALYARGYAGSIARFAAVVLADTDGDGRVSQTFPADIQAMSVVAVDLTTGAYSYGAVNVDIQYRALPAHSIVPGPDGSFTQLVLPQEIVYPMWVRPGVGMWIKTGAYDDDDDGTTYNDYKFLTTAAFRESSPGAPGAFQKGDVFVCILRDDVKRIYVESVDSHLDAPRLPGTVSFTTPFGISVNEGQTAQFRLMRVGGSEGAVSVRARVATSTGAAGVDYQPFDTTVTFNSGEVLKTIPLTTIDDAFYAGAISLTLELDEPAGTTIAPTKTRPVKIQSNDPPPTVAFGDFPTKVSEGNSRWTLSVPITITGATRVPAVVSTAVEIGTATNRDPITIPPGQTSASTSVPISGDAIAESDETIRIAVAGHKDVEGSQSAQITVADDDLTPVTVPADKDFGETEQFVHLQFSAMSGIRPGSKITYQTVDGTATAGSDYEALSGTMEIRPDSALLLTLRNDTQKEAASETFYIDITGINAAPSRQRITVRLWDDESAPQPAVQTVSAIEGKRGDVAKTPVAITIPAPWPVKLSGTISVWEKTATDYADYTTDSPPRFSIEAGQTQTSFNIWVRGDDVDEPNETMTVRASWTPENYGESTFTILDDDSSLSVADTSAPELTNMSSEAVFNVTLADPVQTEVRVQYATENGTAIANSDYIAATGELVFTPGETSKDVRVIVLGDSDTEATETFTLKLTNATGAGISDGTAEALIFDNDASARTLFVHPAVAYEETGRQSSAIFVVRLGSAVTDEVRVAYATEDVTAVAGADYVAARGTLTFLPGETEKQIEVTILDDDVDESRETFRMLLSNPVNATIVTGAANASINDDDTPRPPVLTIPSVTLREGDVGSTDVSFELILSKPMAVDGWIDVVTVDGTATAPHDYAAATFRIHLPRGATRAAFAIRVYFDTLSEADETFTFRFVSPDVMLPANAPTCTIVNDDGSTRKRAVRR